MVYVVCFGVFSPNVCSYYFSSVWVVEWLAFGKEQLTRLNLCSLLCFLYSLCILFDYFPVLVLRAGFCSVAPVPVVVVYL